MKQASELTRRRDAPAAPSAWRAVIAGFCASLVGIGLARFAYTPLLPALVGAHWFAPAGAAYLGAANLLGYLGGALLGRPATRYLPAHVALRAMMLLATAALFACARPQPFHWFFFWRLASGLAGGVLMVLAAPSVLAHVPPSRRGIAGGVIFTGVGVGIAASGTLVPLLLRQGLTEAWLGLGTLSLALTAIAWRGWPQDGKSAPVRGHRPRASAPLRTLYAQYALNAVGLVPHMIFLVDFVARGLGQGVQAGAAYWVLFGLGAMAGPLLSGHLADRIGFANTLRCAYVVQAAAVALPALGGGPPWLMLSAVVVGAFTPGIVPLALGRLQELLARHPAQQRAAWGTATAGFALLQAGAAYGMSFLFAHGREDYPLLFLLGAGALALALAAEAIPPLAEQRADRSGAASSPHAP